MKSSRRAFIKSSATLAAMTGAVALAGRTATAGTDSSRFRVLHASPDAPAIDVWVNRTRVAPDLRYTKFSKDWFYPATTAVVRIFTVGAPLNSPPLFQKQITFDVGRTYTLVVTGLLQQPPNSPQGLDIVRFEDPPRPAAGLTTMRLAHVAPGVGNVDLFTAANEPFILDVAFKSAKAVEKPAGTYDLQVRLTGQPNALFVIPPTNFPSAQVRTIYVFAQSQNATARALNETTSPAFVIR
jgi:hypothetical protein